MNLWQVDQVSPRRKYKDLKLFRENWKSGVWMVPGGFMILFVILLCVKNRVVNAILFAHTHIVYVHSIQRSVFDLMVVILEMVFLTS